MGGLIRLFEIMARNDINNRGMKVDKLESGGGKEGRKEGWGGVWLPTFAGLKSQSSWRNRGGWRELSYRLPITI